MKKSVFIIVILVAVIVTACNKMESNNASSKTSKTTQQPVGAGLDIIVTNKCLYKAVKQIAGNNNNVDYMFKDKDEEANFKYTSDSTSNIGKQDLFMYTGIEFGTWMDDFLSKIDKSKVLVVNTSRGVSTLSYGNKNDTVNYGNKNPYYWTEIDNYRTMLLNIKNAIEDKDPKNTNIYDNNFKNAIKEIDKYKVTINDLSDKIKTYDFVADSDDTDYVLDNFNEKLIKFYRSNEGAISPDDEQKISSEASNNKNLCFVYDNDNDLNANKDIIDKYHMKTVKLTVYDGNMSYMDMIKQNVTSISNALK